ncbi:MAG: TolC family protein [Acidobacteria bacterium]|nr:TolC family protein [Acidobacteriota bacterium]
MRRLQSTIALLNVWLLTAPGLFAQQPSAAPARERNWFNVGAMSKWYEGASVAPISVANSSRLESLVRAGTLYLSLRDCIAAALENNIDIEVQRYTPRLAATDLLRAKAGSSIRGVTATGLSTGYASATATSVAASTVVSATNTAAANATTAGPAALNLDPALTGNIQFSHTTTPQSTTFLTSTNTLITRQKVANFTLQQQFLSGTTAQFGYFNTNSDTTSLRNQFNPVTASYFDLNISQHLLQGFGLAVNNRNIRIAKNNLHMADLIFKQQVTNTVANVIGLYWDLVAYNEDVAVKRGALSVSKKLYDDNRKQVEVGTLAPIEIIRAEAEVAAREQDLTTSETNVLQQETILKSALSRNGVASPTIAEVHIVPTDHIQLPADDAAQPIQDLIARAMENRPELGQIQTQIENSKISLKGTRNSMLPTIDAFVDLKNRGQAGSLNTLPGAATGGDAFFIGGYGTVLDQLFSRNFPDYSAGFSLNIPLRNRAAQADYSTAQLNLRQSELTYQRQLNNVRLDVQNALISVRQARARYLAAEKSRQLQVQTLDAEQKKYALGSSTVFLVIQAQRDLATSEGTRVAALAAYARARTLLNYALGETLKANGVEIDDARRGVVPTPPSALPAATPGK